MLWPMQIFKTLRRLYEGREHTSYLFRYALLSLDITTLIFLVISSFFYGHPLVEKLEIFFGAYILLDFLARFLIQRKKILFFLRFHTFIDLLVIFSFTAPIIGQQLAFLRAFALLRMLRSYLVLKRLREDFRFFREHEDLMISIVNLSLFIFVMTELVFQTQVTKNPQIKNFIDAMYFTITTLTTTGFGDIILQGTLGRGLSIVIMIFGVSLFIRLMQTLFRPHKVRFICPTCGLFLHDRDAVCCKHCGETLAIPDDGLN